MTLNVTYIVEHPNRELRTCRKIHSDLFSHLDFKFLLFPFEILKIYLAHPNIIVLPNAKKLYKHLSKIFPNATFIILNFEQQLNTINIDQIVSCQSARSIACSWSKDFTEVLKQKGYNKVVEMPKLDYVDRNYDCDTTSSEYDIFVGFTDLHAFIDPKQSIMNYNQSSELSTIIERYEARASWAYDNVVSFLRYIFEEASSHDLKIILKPHPLVSVEEYNALFSRLNLHIPASLEFSNVDSMELIAKSDVLVTNYSSLAIDARLMGKPVWAWLPKPMPGFMDLEWVDFLPKLTSKNNLSALNIKQDLNDFDAYIDQNFLLNRNIYKERLRSEKSAVVSQQVRRRFPLSQLRLMIYFLKCYVFGVLKLIPANRKHDYLMAHFIRGTKNV